MPAALTVKYRPLWRWSSVGGIVCAAALALPLSAAVAYAFVVPEQRGSSADFFVGAAVAAGSWLLVAFLVANLLARRSWKGGIALLADETGITFPDWRGRTKLLRWSEINCLHLLRTRNSLLLIVEGSYDEAEGNPATFPTDELDMDPQALLRELERIRPKVDTPC